MAVRRLKTTITETGVSTAVFTLRAGQRVNLDIKGTWTGTLTLEGSYAEDPDEWYALPSFTANPERLKLEAVEDGERYRVTSSGTWTGTATIRFGLPAGER